MPMTQEDIDAAFRRAVDDGILSDDPRSPVYAAHMMLMRIDGDGAHFKHRETRMYLSADGSYYYSWDFVTRYSLDEHHAFLGSLLTERARLHGSVTVPRDLRYLIGRDRAAPRPEA